MASTRSLGRLTLDLALRSGLFEQGMDRAARKADRRMKEIEQSAARMTRRLGTALGVGAAGLGLRELAQTADAWTNIGNRLRLVTGSTAELTQVQERLFDVAQRTRSGLEGTVDLYSRIARNARELGLSQAQLLTLTETINQAVQLSGVSAESANAALVQLGQGFASGTLRGEELNSVMEQTPALAEAIARGLGVPIGRLREMGQAGELTAQRVSDALLKSAQQVNAEFNKLAPTIGQALTNINNEFLKFVGGTSDATAASATLAATLQLVARNFDTVATAALAAGAVFGARTLDGYIAKLATATAAQARAIVGANARAAAAVKEAQATAAATAAAHAKAVMDQRAALAAMQAAQGELRIALAMEQGVARTAAVTAATERLTAARAALATTTQAVRTTEAAATASTVALTRATNGATVAAKAAALATRAWAGALALVGGPWGAAILALGGAWMLHARSTQKAKEELDAFAESARKMTQVELGRAISDTQIAIVKLEGQIAALDQAAKNAGIGRHLERQLRAAQESMRSLIAVAQEAVTALDLPTQEELDEREVERLSRLIRLQIASSAEHQRAREIIRATEREMATLSATDEKTQTRRIKLQERINALKGQEPKRPLEDLSRETQTLARQYEALTRAGLIGRETADQLAAAYRRANDALTAPGATEATKAAALEIMAAIEGALDRTGDLTQRLALVGERGIVPASLLAETQRAYDHVTASIERQGGPHRANLDLLQRQLVLADALDTAYRRVTRTVTAATPPTVQTPQLVEVREAVARLEEAQRRLRLVTTAGAPPEAVREAQERAAEATGRLADAQRALAVRLLVSNLSAEDQKKILEELDELLRRVGASSEDATRKAAGALQSLTTAGRGLLQVADATNKIGQNARRSVDGVLSLVDSFQQLREAREAARKAEKEKDTSFDQAANTVQQISAFAGIAGGVVSAVSGIVGALTQQSERERMRDAVIEKNTEALNRASDSLDGFRNTLGDITGGLDAFARFDMREFLAFATGVSRFPIDQQRRFLDAALAQFGVSFAELNRLAEANGITLLDEKGRVVAGAFEQLNEMLELTRRQLLTFDDSLEDVRKKQEAYNAIFDVDLTPALEFEQAVERLNAASGPLADLFANIDVTTAQGREAAESLLRRLYESAVAGFDGEFADLLANSKFKSVEEFVDWIVSADSALDRFAETADKATAAMQNVPTGFRIALARFNAQTPTDVVGPPVIPESARTYVPTTPADTRGQPVSQPVLQPINYYYHGDVYIDAREKSVGQAFDEWEQEANRRLRSRYGSLTTVMLHDA